MSYELIIGKKEVEDYTKIVSVLFEKKNRIRIGYMINQKEKAEQIFEKLSKQGRVVTGEDAQKENYIKKVVELKENETEDKKKATIEVYPENAPSHRIKIRGNPKKEIMKNIEKIILEKSRTETKERLVYNRTVYKNAF